MYICGQCKGRLGHTGGQKEYSRPFPAFTVAGGVLGTIAAAATGVLLAVPAAVVLGAAVDTKRCGICGAPMQEDNEGYHLMEELPGESGFQVYRPLAKSSPRPAPEQSPWPAERTAGNQGQGPGGMRVVRPAEALASQPGLEGPDKDGDYRFDAITGKLTRVVPEVDVEASPERPQPATDPGALDGPASVATQPAGDAFSAPLVDEAEVLGDGIPTEMTFPEPPIDGRSQ